MAAVQVKSAELLTGYFDAAYEEAIRFVNGLSEDDMGGVVDELDPAGDPGRAAGQRDLRRPAARRAGHVRARHVERG